jgi:hypothetical protein
MSQHAGLTEERWPSFGIDQQILMVGNEMNRTSRSLDSGQMDAVRRGYERILNLTDLTVSCARRPSLRRELLRWRDVVARQYVDEEPDPLTHRAAFRALLQLTPAAAKQIPLLAGV